MLFSAVDCMRAWKLMYDISMIVKAYTPSQQYRGMKLRQLSAEGYIQDLQQHLSGCSYTLTTFSHDTPGNLTREG